MPAKTPGKSATAQIASPSRQAPRDDVYEILPDPPKGLTGPEKRRWVEIGAPLVARRTLAHSDLDPLKKYVCLSVAYDRLFRQVAGKNGGDKCTHRQVWKDVSSQMIVFAKVLGIGTSNRGDSKIMVPAGAAPPSKNGRAEDEDLPDIDHLVQ